MNIKNPEAERLVRELAALTHQNLTGAIIEAVKERLGRLKQAGEAGGPAERLMAIGRDCAPRLKEPFRSADHGDLLYDERGLPE